MMFFTYKKVDDEHLYMRNSSTSNILSVGKVILKMTFKKLLTINNVIHVANIRKNLMSSVLLSKYYCKMVFESDKFVL